MWSFFFPTLVGAFGGGKGPMSIKSQIFSKVEVGMSTNVHINIGEMITIFRHEATLRFLTFKTF